MIDEAGAGDPTAAQGRLTLLDDLPLLDIQHPEVRNLADQLIANHLLPEKAAADARHVAVSTVFGVDYLWLIRIKRIVAQEVEVYWRKLCCTNGLPEPLPSSPSHRPFRPVLEGRCEGRDGKGRPLLLLSERRSSWSEISGFSHHNTLNPDEPQNSMHLQCSGITARVPRYCSPVARVPQSVQSRAFRGRQR